MTQVEIHGVIKMKLSGTEPTASQSRGNRRNRDDTLPHKIPARISTSHENFEPECGSLQPQQDEERLIKSERRCCREKD